MHAYKWLAMVSISYLEWLLVYSFEYVVTDMFSYIDSVPRGVIS